MFFFFFFRALCGGLAGVVKGKSLGAPVTLVGLFVGSPIGYGVFLAF